MKYRTDDAYGNKITDAVSVIIYEMFVLDNIDIPYTLCNGILKNTLEAEQLSNIVSYLNGEIDTEGLLDVEFDAVYQYYCEDNDGPLKQFIGHILNKVYEITGIKVNHVLWLCDTIKAVAEQYGKGISGLTVLGYDECKTVILSDLGRQGKLYGFTILPKEKERWLITSIRYNLWEKQH